MDCPDSGKQREQWICKLWAAPLEHVPALIEAQAEVETHQCHPDSCSRSPGVSGDTRHQDQRDEAAVLHIATLEQCAQATGAGRRRARGSRIHPRSSFKDTGSAEEHTPSESHNVSCSIVPSGFSTQE